jgi:hypothetical protein
MVTVMVSQPPTELSSTQHASKAANEVLGRSGQEVIRHRDVFIVQVKDRDNELGSARLVWLWEFDKQMWMCS